MNIKFQQDLLENIDNFILSLEDPKNEFHFSPVLKSNNKNGKELNLGFSCFAIKCLYTTQKWSSFSSDLQKRWIEYINSFQNDLDGYPENSFVDLFYIKGFKHKSFID